MNAVEAGAVIPRPWVRTCKLESENDGGGKRDGREEDHWASIVADGDAAAI
jgi:hypothetical protein